MATFQQVQLIFDLRFCKFDLCDTHVIAKCKFESELMLSEFFYVLGLNQAIVNFGNSIVIDNICIRK